MIYQVHWEHEAKEPKLSRFATWDGVVVDASIGLKWTLGMSFDRVRHRLFTMRAMAVAIPNTWHRRKV